MDAAYTQTGVLAKGRAKGWLTRSTQQANHHRVAVSCELGLKETTAPTGGSQHREYWGGPTNGQAAACRRRPRRRVRGGSSQPAPCQVARTVLLPPSLVVSVHLRSRLRCPARGVYPATQTAPAAPVLVHLFRRTATISAAATTNPLCTTITHHCPGLRCRCRGCPSSNVHPAVVVLPEPAATTDLLLPSRPTATGTTSRATTTCPTGAKTLLHCPSHIRRPSTAAATGPPPSPRPAVGSASLPPLIRCCRPPSLPVSAPQSLERIRREMRQAEPPARGGEARASLGLYVVFGCSLLLSQGARPGFRGGVTPFR